jgi:hypothetical protein
MLPNANDRPASLRQQPVGVEIPLLIPVDLGFPELLIRLWVPEMKWAAMPKAAVHENGDPQARKDEIRRTARALDRR